MLILLWRAHAGCCLLAVKSVAPIGVLQCAQPDKAISSRQAEGSRTGISKNETQALARISGHFCPKRRANA
ncbi:MAG TPA: hypothetical protein VF928_03195 [Usitatibacteraceae bacterium]